MTRMPVIFAGHGSPTNVVERNRFTDGWREMAAAIPRPLAILCVSAHWYGEGAAVSAAERPETIHDFYGFPQALYEIDYPAPGAPELAMRAADLSGKNTHIDAGRGLDHGAWSVLRSMYPQADVPVCQLRVDASLSPRQSYEAGARLVPLREEGVLILGSGDVVHNLSMVDWEMANGYPWADEFDAYIESALRNGRHDDAIDYERAGHAAELAFSYRDHYDPLLYALGATDAGEHVRVYNDERVLGSISMTSYLMGAES